MSARSFLFFEWITEDCSWIFFNNLIRRIEFFSMGTINLLLKHRRLFISFHDDFFFSIFFLQDSNDSAVRFSARISFTICNSDFSAFILIWCVGLFCYFMTISGSSLSDFRISCIRELFLFFLISDLLKASARVFCLPGRYWIRK